MRNLMSNKRFVLFWLLLILPLTLSANWPPQYGPRPGAAPYQPHQFRPMPQNNVRGTPPVSPQQYQQPYSQPQANIRPTLELIVKDTTPYVQENTLLTLRVISGSNISRIDPILPQDQSIMFHKIRDPTAYTRNVRGRPQIVNEVVYLITPLQDGSLELPIKADIETAGNGYGSQSMRLESTQPLSLEVRPAQAGVLPWLPLEQLTLTSNITSGIQVEEGKPISLVLKLNAIGATGGQLPSLERLLQSPDFRVYKEKTDTKGGLSKNGRHIMGNRTEHYTLVPQYGGDLRLPSARMGWFNVNSGTVEYSSLPIKTVQASGIQAGLERFFGSEAGGQSMFPAGYASSFWAPLTGILLLFVGYWVGVWFKGRKVEGKPSAMNAIGNAARNTADGARQKTNRLLSHLNPLRYVRRAMARSASMMPLSVRFWFWVRCANDESDPGLWCRTLQFLSCRQLSLSPHAPLPEVAERVIECQPSANPEKVRALFKQLDGSLYGHEEIDFERWKKELKRQVRPGVRSLFRSANKSGKKGRRLPDLNPKAAA